ncbi:MAG: carbohydrate kinase family protein [Planctomycetes bacterium]|nr:carbohydrate kinase family protein [Planctomycetota bacterium]
MPGSLDCLCAGIIVADSVCQPIASLPPPGSLARTERVEFTIGGCAANVAVDMARLGLRVGVSGRVGNDVFGREVRDRLVAASVECSGLILSQTAPTSSTFVLNVRGEDRRFIHCVGANAEYDGLQVTADQIRQARVLYVGGFGLLEALSPEHVVRMFRLAREANVVTILDVVLPERGDQLLSWIREVLPWTDYFFPNNDESTQLLDGEQNPEKQTLRFREYGAQTVVITCGSRGAVLASPTHRLKSGVYPVEPVDATGTGDAFVSGFVLGLLSKSSPEKCLELGTAMGASCVRCMGATTGVFDAGELEQFVADHSMNVSSW